MMTKVPLKSLLEESLEKPATFLWLMLGYTEQPKHT